MTDATRLLNAVARGEPNAASQLLPLVYDELRRLAAQKIAGERAGQSLDATSLVHEAYLRLVSGHPGQPWDGRRHFFAAAAEAMRRILIDRVRRRRRRKHGGDRQRVDLDQVGPAADSPAEDLLALDEALTRFAAEEPAKAELVKLRYFVGCSLEASAELLGISLATAKRHWAYARAWLFHALTGETPKRT